MILLSTATRLLQRKSLTKEKAYQFIMAAGMNGYTNSLELEDRPREIKTFAFFDLETTGLKDPVRITELSIIAVRRGIFLDRVQKFCQAKKNEACPGDLVDAATARVVDKFSVCLDPRKPIEYVAQKITGLSNLELEHQGPFDDSKFFAVNQFLSQLETPVCLVAHNGNSFDFPILKGHIDALGKTFIPGLLCVDSIIGLREIIGKQRMETRVVYEAESKIVTSSSSVIHEEQIRIATSVEIVPERSGGRAARERGSQAPPRTVGSCSEEAGGRAQPLGREDDSSNVNLNREQVSAQSLQKEEGDESARPVEVVSSSVRGRGQGLREEEELSEVQPQLKVNGVETSCRGDQEEHECKAISGAVGGKGQVLREDRPQKPVGGRAETLRREDKEGSPRTELAKLAGNLSLSPQVNPSVSEWTMGGEEITRFGLSNGVDTLDMIIAEIAADDDSFDVVDGAKNIEPAPEVSGDNKSPPRVIRTFKFSTPSIERARSFEDSTTESESETSAIESESDTKGKLTLKEKINLLRERQARTPTSAPENRSRVIRSVKFGTPSSERALRAMDRSTLTPKRLFTPSETESEFATPLDTKVKKTPLAKQKDQPVDSAGSAVDAVGAKKRLFDGDGVSSPHKLRDIKPKTFKLGDLYQYYFNCEMTSAHEAEADVKALMAVAVAAGSEFVEWMDSCATDFNCVKGRKSC